MRIAAYALALLIALFGAVPAAAAAPSGDPKVVIVVGPAGPATDRYREQAEEAAKVAERHTSNVVRLYSPDATWPAVRDALQGAAIVVYMGHGNGWPSRYRDSLYGATQNGFGLNPVAGGGDDAHQYFGEDRIAADVELADNAIVLLHHLCYASGNTEPGLPEGTVEQARQRVDNYAAGFIAAGAGAVVAEGHMGPAWYVKRLLTGSQSIERIWRASPNNRGHEFSFESTRSPGFAARMDPDRGTSGFYRSLVSRGGVGAGRLTGAPVTTVADPAEPSLVGRGLTMETPYFRQRPLAGRQTELWIPFSTTDSRALAGLTVGVRWDPIDVAEPPDDESAEPEPPAEVVPSETPEASAEPVETDVRVPSAEASPAPESATGEVAPSVPSVPVPNATQPPEGRSGPPGLSPDGRRGPVRPAPSTEPSVVVPQPAVTEDPSTGRYVFIEPERVGSVVQPVAARIGKTRLVAPVTAPTQQGRYRLVVTLHDASGVAYDAATQAALPVLNVRVSGEIDAGYLVAGEATATTDQTMELPVAVANIGSTEWGSATTPGRRRLEERPTTASLVAHWVRLDAAGDVPLPNDVEAALPAGFAPGATQRTILALDAPAVPGTYLLVVDVVVPGVGSLAAAGVGPALVRVTVG